MEIERKFLVKQLPENLGQYPKYHIEQGYICTEPVIRIRQRDQEFFLTCKGQGFLKREEHEMSLTAEEYSRLSAKVEGQLIVKDRYCIPCGEYTIELDVFSAPFAPLVIAEVEFSTEEAAKAFQVPDWFGEEVTFDPSYTNAVLSKRPSASPEICPGRYRHFKGNEYEVLEVAVHSETEEPMVVYRALYGEEKLWVRPASMWNETIVRDGKTVQRFSYVEGAKKK